VNLLSRRALRGAFLTLCFGVLVSAAPAVARAGESEPAASEAPGSDVTTLVLEPVCTAGGLHRFAVNSVEGPDTHFTVAAAGGAGGETMAIEAGETRHFWVAQQAAPVQIAWDDGSASATGVDEACGPDMVPSDVLVEPLPPSATDAPPPTSPTSRPSRHSEEPTAPSTATGKPAPEAAAPAERRDREDSAEPETSPRAAEASGDEGQARDRSVEPRPRLFDGTMVCPDGWLPVDSDADGRFEASDSCEVLVETAAQASATGEAFPTVALIVTIGLLVASIGLGAVGRRRA
jgi:hypothetical protein